MCFSRHPRAPFYSRRSGQEYERPRLGRYRFSGRQRGAFAIMFVPLLVVMLAFFGLALELAQLYNRKVESHGMAKAVALAAANELNGTTAGVTAALDRAKITAEKFKANYSQTFTWSNAAISFSTTAPPDANWVDAESAKSEISAPTMWFVKVDTSKLDAESRTLTPIFMKAVSASNGPVVISDRAIAGRTGIKVTPLAICALDPREGVARGTELVQYGFRRGVSYDLMQLNPGGLSPANYVIDPKIAPGDATTLANTSADAVGPFVCTGTMWMPRVTGGAIRISSPFPLDSLYRHLNSRFDQYLDNVCSPNGAPPDLNVRPFTKDTGAAWMSPVQHVQTAAPYSADGKLRTIADPDPPLSSSLAKDDLYGPLWSYARAVKWSSYTSGVPEPVNGYATFLTGNWPTLYPSGPTAPGYPISVTATPYKAYVTLPPTHPALGQLHRRVLNVPLLACPVSSSSASVLAIGKFFMTIPATQTTISAEFAGLAPETTLGSEVELFP